VATFKYLDYSFFKSGEYKNFASNIDLLSELMVDKLIDRELNKIFFNSVPNSKNGKFITLVSGRASLLLALQLLNLADRSEVLILGHTCVEVYHAITCKNLIPIVVDIDINTLGFDVQDLNNKTNTNTKVIIIQHHLGVPCNDSIFDWARLKGLFIIEDCCLTFGSFNNDTIVGVKGDISIFSFGKSKPINCYVGGLIWVSSTYIDLLDNTVISSLPTAKILPMKVFFKLEVNAYNSNNYLFKIFVLNISKYVFRKLGIHDHIDSVKNDKNSVKLMPLYFKRILLCNLLHFPQWRTRLVLIKNKLLEYLRSNNLIDKLPDVYFNKSLDIVSHRLIILDYDHRLYQNELLGFCDSKKLFYSNPVDGLNMPHDHIIQNCRNSINLSKRMLQIPLTTDLLQYLN
jgi:hypothetical protein